MTYGVLRGEPLTDGLRRIVEDQVGSALGELGDQGLSVHETIHQVRKRCKKIRAALRLVRPGLDAYDEANARFRDTAGLLSDHRDAQSHLEALDALDEHYSATLPSSTLAPVREGLHGYRERLCGPGSDVNALLAEVESELELSLQDLDGWRVKGERYQVIASGVAKSYGRGRRAFDAAYEKPSAERFHQWRKRSKYHRYHVRLLADAWPDVLNPVRHALHDLTDLLGDAHDLAELRAHVIAVPEAFGGREPVQVMVALADQRRAELRAKANGLGARVFCEPTKQAGRRYAAYLRAWDQEDMSPFARLDGADRPEHDGR